MRLQSILSVLFLISAVVAEAKNRFTNDSLALLSGTPGHPGLKPGYLVNYVPEAARPAGHKTGQAKPEVRPFITDDARVVGNKLAQIEGWGRVERHNFQQWLMFGYGLTEKTELSVGGVFGWEKDESAEGNDKNTFAYALPLLQAKFLFREYAPGKGPGFGMVLGTFLPAGSGSFKPAGYGTFGFLTISQCFGEGEKLLLHGNLGSNYLHIDGNNDLIGTWGFGSQLKTIGGFHLVAELFSGDPYVPGTGTAYQAGFRHFFSDNLQIDMTVGEGIAGENKLPFWVSFGVRIVTEKFRKANQIGLY